LEAAEQASSRKEGALLGACCSAEGAGERALSRREGALRGVGSTDEEAGRQG
jgi:hypothetical protein